MDDTHIAQVLVEKFMPACKGLAERLSLLEAHNESLDEDERAFLEAYELMLKELEVYQ